MWQNAYAADLLGGPLVPQCSGPFEGACQLCDLLTLLQNLINFAIGFSILVATGMFVYAGILYFTAAAKQDNIKKAHGIFMKVFIGLIFVLGAWLIVDLVLSTLTGKGIGPWVKVDCAAWPQGSGGTPVGTPGSGSGNGGVSGSGGGGGSQMSADEKTARTNLAGICVGASNYNGCDAPSCGGLDYDVYRARYGTGCTNVAGYSSSMVTNLKALQTACGTYTIKGGTEGGHKSHGPNLSTVDVAYNESLAQCISKNRESLGIKQICTPNALAQYRYNCTTNEGETHLHLGY